MPRSSITFWMRPTPTPCSQLANSDSTRLCARWPSWTCPKFVRCSQRFHSAAIQRFAEIYEEPSGQHVVLSGVKVSSYLTPFARKTQGIIGQPEPQWYFHRAISTLFHVGFEAGFVVDGIEE